MTAWRVGLAIKPEKPNEFGKEDATADWHFIGPAMDLNFTEQNNWKYQTGLGSKTPELEYEGRFGGTFSGNVYLDYNNFYWLLFGLEGYSFGTENFTKEDGSSGTRGIHQFSTSNVKAMRSFSLRIVKLNREVGGPYDEDQVLLGCVMSKIIPTR